MKEKMQSFVKTISKSKVAKVAAGTAVAVAVPGPTLVYGGALLLGDTLWDAK